ncbi:MAG: peptidyl-prolyl cis-trans isomerase, partial [Solirubrobacterales bacterium]
MSLARNKLIIAISLGVALVLVVVGFAAFRGLGPPSVPAGDIAVVENVDPDDVSEADYQEAEALLLASQGLEGEPPEEGSEQFQANRAAAVNDVLIERWLLGEAQERGYEISDREIDQRLDEIKETSFANEREFERFVEQSGFDDEEILRRVRLQVINERIQDELVQDIPEVSDAEVQAFYDQSEDQFTRPASREVRLILNEDEEVLNEARAELEEDDRGRTWRRLANELSEDEASRNQGGRLTGVVEEGQTDPEFTRQAFAAAEGELIGPFETESGFYLIQVVGTTPEEVTTLEEISETIRSQIAATRQQEEATLSQNRFLQKWAGRTICAEGFITSQCRNAPPFPRPPGAPPVLSSAPVAPGLAGRIGAPLPPQPQTPYP